jgi:hypothetical protein
MARPPCDTHPLFCCVCSTEQLGRATCATYINYGGMKIDLQKRRTNLTHDRVRQPLLLFTVTLYYYDYFRHMGGASPAWSQQVVVVVTVHSTSPICSESPHRRPGFERMEQIIRFNNLHLPIPSEKCQFIRPHLVSEIWKTPNFSQQRSDPSHLPTSAAMLCCGPSVNMTNQPWWQRAIIFKNIF